MPTKFLRMPTKFRLFLLLSTIAITSRAQSPVLFNIGDPAPPLRLRAWLKGGPVNNFEKGKVYVLEFWATWCKPCLQAMPHLSAIANEYKGKANVIAVDVSEKATTSVVKIKTLVDSMGRQMDFQVAAEDSNYMLSAWQDSTGEGRGIPKTFVVDAQGRLAWVGSPMQVDEVLPKIVDGTWDIKEELATRNERRRLTELSDSLGFELSACRDKPDSTLRMIAGYLRKEPQMKYFPAITTHTFNALLKTNPHKAFEYGRELLSAPGNKEQNDYFVYGSIEDYLGEPGFPAEIFLLGVAACQAGIDNRIYPDSRDDASLYHKMAAFYWRIANKARAIDAEQKAIETLKGQPGSSARLSAYQSQLHKYSGSQLDARYN